MSTTPVESWVVGLAEVGPIYPFVGSEGLLVVLLLVAWLGWHFWQIKHEKEQEEEIINKADSSSFIYRVVADCQKIIPNAGQNRP